MGADEFTTLGVGKSMADAFRQARERAQWEHGHGGYSGTIAEKGNAVVVGQPSQPLPLDKARELAWAMMENDDPRVSDKWGPAGAIRVDTATTSTGTAEGMEAWLFFGWASS